MNEELLKAYRATRYMVEITAEKSAIAAIGSTSKMIDDMLREHGASSGVFITAWNPRSEPTDEEVNRAYDLVLVDHLDRAGFRLFRHLGIGSPDYPWPPEEGLFVLDMDDETATRIAVLFGQYAFVSIRLGEPARLVLTPLAEPPGA